jgi:hypothetical protein
MSTRGHPWLVIGATERVSLPALNVRGLRAKVDTGARTSSLHVEDMEWIGTTRVRFRNAHAKGERLGPLLEVRVSRTGSVKPSNARAEERPFIDTQLVLGPLERKIELSLTSRMGMRYRMLLGREAIAGTCQVDPGRRNVLKAFK